MIELTAIFDEGSLDSGKRQHFVFPNKQKHEDRTASPISGGLYFQEGVDIPETIVIKIVRR